MGVYRKPLDLYKAQVQRFARVQGNARRLHQLLAEDGLEDARELTAGGIGPNGPGRKRWLKRAGHPYGRGKSAASSTPGGLMRGVAKGKRNRVGLKAQVRGLPIGMISGRLHRNAKLAKRSRLRGQEFGLSFSAPYAKHILNPRGTKRMAGRGFGGIQGQNAPKTGEMVRRWRARNKALLDTLKRQGRI